MRTLGIDYGKSKIGLAIADGPLAEPLKVIKVKDLEDAVHKLLQILQVEHINKVVIGLSEGKMAEETKRFASIISHRSSIKMEMFDETLTSQDAQTLSIQAGINRKKRREMEDAYAAAIILQNWLDGNH